MGSGTGKVGGQSMEQRTKMFGMVKVEENGEIGGIRADWNGCMDWKGWDAIDKRGSWDSKCGCHSGESGE